MGYLCFVTFGEQLNALKHQEYVGEAKIKLSANKHLTDKEKEQFVLPLAENTKVAKPEEELPGYMVKLTGAYDARCYWFEIFESLRKVLLVGVPACSPDRGGNAQLVGPDGLLRHLRGVHVLRAVR